MPLLALASESVISFKQRILKKTVVYDIGLALLLSEVKVKPCRN